MNWWAIALIVIGVAVGGIGAFSMLMAVFHSKKIGDELWFFIGGVAVLAGGIYLLFG